jgi:hypothetical protein
MEEKILLTDYNPGRTLAEMEEQQIKERLSHSPTQSFRILMDLIRISEKMKKAKIIHVSEH